ncbi:MAG: hypothetical protein IPI67_10175 [Myxococcales bacterium]|nr:hypothetical protein [Myxococcales bacterium]
MALWRGLSVLVFCLLSTACGLFKQLEIDSPGHSVQKPSNVAVYLSVNDGNTPLTELTEQNFTIFENDQALSSEDSKLTLLDRELAAHHRALLLVDMSTAKDADTRTRIARGAAGFVAAVRKTQGVTVYAFDGGVEPKLIGEYAKGESGPAELPELAAFVSADPSRNLNGAVQAGLKELDARLMGQQKPIRIGTLIVLTAGPDVAGRATTEAVQATVDASPHQIVVIAVGAEGAFDVGAVAKTSTLWAPSLGGVGPTFDEAATHVDALLQRHYLLAYCSPARAGIRHVRVEITHQNTEGDERRGSFDFEFDATGFGPGCDSASPPRFGGVEQAKEEKPEAKKGDDKKPDTKGDGKKGAGDDGIVPPPNKPGYAPLPPK